MSFGWLLWRNLLRRKLRTVLAVFTVLCAFAIYGALSVYGSSYDYAIGPEAEDRLLTKNKVSFVRHLPGSYVERVAAVPGVRDVTYATWFAGYYQDPRSTIDSYAVEPASWLTVFADWKVPAAQRECVLKERNGFLAGDQLAKRLGWHVGQIVSLGSLEYSRSDRSNEWPLRLCGIFRVGSPYGITDWAVLRHDHLEKETGLHDEVGEIVFTTSDPRQNASIAARIDELFVNTAVPTLTTNENQHARAFYDETGDFRALLFINSSAAFLTLLLIVANTMGMNVRERGKELAIMRALGFSRGRLFGLVVAEALTILFLGGVLGLVAGGLLVAATGNPRAAMAYDSVIPALGIMLLLGLAVGALPAQRASRTAIVATLTRE